MTSRQAGDPVTDAARALERAVPMLVRWFTRGDVRTALLGDVTPALSATDAWLLGRIADTGPVRLSDLAAWQEVDRSTMTTQVRRLEALDLVSRAPDPGDGRAVLVRATPAGAARHQRTKEAARPVYGALLDGWSDDDLRNAAHVAGLLVRTLEHPGRPSQ